jgi:riboflavin synthase
MFTGIVQGMATVSAVRDRPQLRSLTLQFPPGFAHGLTLGASVAVDGVCLTVTAMHPAAEPGHGDAPGAADFDVMQQTLSLTTLAALQVGSVVNVERAACEGAEIGGHPLSGHVDFTATLQAIRRPENNHVLRFSVPKHWMRYIFAKGYIAINGASLTVAEARREEGWFEVWLIPETLRMTTFGLKTEGDALNIEIERATQVMVDSVDAAVQERLGPLLSLLPALRAFAQERGLSLGEAP